MPRHTFGHQKKIIHLSSGGPGGGSNWLANPPLEKERQGILLSKVLQHADAEERYVLLFRLAALTAKAQKHPDAKLKLDLTESRTIQQVPSPPPPLNDNPTPYHQGALLGRVYSVTLVIFPP